MISLERGPGQTRGLAGTEQNPPPGRPPPTPSREGERGRGGEIDRYDGRDLDFRSSFPEPLIHILYNPIHWAGEGVLGRDYPRLDQPTVRGEGREKGIGGPRLAPGTLRILPPSTPRLYEHQVHNQDQPILPSSPPPIPPLRGGRGGGRGQRY